MTKKVKFVGLLFITAVFTPVQVIAQDDEVRGAFMTTRPKTSTQPKAGTKPNRRAPKVVKHTPDKTNPSDPNIKDRKPNPEKTVAQRIGVGLTLFMRDSNGMSVRTDPAREFRSGDRVRVLLETNADGYLYIFNTTDGGPAVMIYPDAELDEGGNYLQAHVPLEIPSSLAAEERLRWFAFDQKPGEEKLYFVFTREPLNGVPIEDDLTSLCRNNKQNCPWKPSAELWAQIQSGLAEPTRSVKSKNYGKVETDSERQATTRGIGLNRDDPEPSLIMLSSSTDKKVLVVSLDLSHKAATAGQ